jgi:mono/diheme cytochrome c family protein
MKKEYINKLKLNGPVFILVLSAFTSIYTQSFSQNAPWNAPKEAGNVKNPFAGNSSVMADGKALYIANCTPCHGDKGKGDGIAAPGLNPKPADHTSVAVQNETDGSLFWKLSEGRAPMPAYKKIFSEQQRWALINYIRTLAKGSKRNKQ